MAESPRRFDLFNHDPSAKRFAPQSVVFSEGDKGEFMYAIKSGRVEIRVGGRAVDALGPGEVFGEMALLENKPRTATVIAMEACELVEINREKFYLLVRQNPHFALQLMQLLSERLRKADALYVPRG